MSDERIADGEECSELMEFFSSLNRGGMYILNAERIEQMKLAYATIKRVLRETNSLAYVVCKQHESILNMGYIDVEANEISIKDTDGFVTVAGLASNTEIYPLDNGKFRMTFTFHGLLSRVQ